MNRPLRIRLRWLLLASLVAACLLAARSDPSPVVPDGLHFMPPHPELSEKLMAEGLSVSELFKLERGIDVPQVIPNPPSGEFNLLVVLVDFPDKTAVVSPDDFDELFFDNFESVADYYDEISYGSLSLKWVDFPSQIGWQRTLNNYEFYVDNDFGWGVYPHNLQGIVWDVVDLIDDEIDFSLYDNDGDGFVDGMVFVHAGEGAEETGKAVDIWSSSWDMSSGNGPGPILTGDGVYVDSFAFGPELSDVVFLPATIGVYAHELGHLLFGLPDLYDLDDSSYGVGNWSLMSWGAWLGGGIAYDGSKPAWPDAWSRIRMGFESPQMITENTAGFEFLPVSSGPGNVVRLWTPNLEETEYFLVEYRQKTGYDVELPESGLLIWHVDEAKWNRWGLNQVECESSPCCACEENHSLLALMQADGYLHLENKTNKGDAGDPFPIFGNNSFKFGTNPESGSYYALACPTDSCIAVDNIDNSLPGVITADLNVICQAQGACVNILTDRVLGWGEAGEDAVYEASIQNCGNADDTLTLSYEGAWLAEFFDLESGEPITATQHSVSAGADWKVGISISVPPDALWSTADVLSLTVNSANDAVISTTVQLTTTVPYCTLVVDDDRGAPDVEEAYINSLVGAGFDFDLWDTQVRGSPDEATLAAHKAVVWFTGTPNRNTLTPHDELGLSTYLQEGGSFFLSSQEYLTDTLRDYFGRNYLRVSTFADNTGTQSVTGVPGNPLSDGLGPYTMSITTTLSDQMIPLSANLSAFTDDDGITNAISYDHWGVAHVVPGLAIRAPGAGRWGGTDGIHVELVRCVTAPAGWL
jgi:immune inhibitor A